MHKVCKERIKTENRTETYLVRFTMCTKLDPQLENIYKICRNMPKETTSDREINFHYIASLENPADFASRGLETEEIRNKDL